MSSSVLKDRDTNAPAVQAPGKVDADNKPESKSDAKIMGFQHQAPRSLFGENISRTTYTSPSDTIMSPCTAKLSAYRGKQAGKIKPKSLFARNPAGVAPPGNLFGTSSTNSLTTEADESKA
ncbi:unnamed protein product [Blumeria hordei]|uniref:Spo12-like protein n=2 Tax=Blumeria hordei TaxID=2867405 RepID=A0A383UTB2_BLUHO|nr:hypothetical protein BGHDH14_bgh01970 [Blumeria hordei DH14]SZF03571.1 unnamed protein product [Blumeria hordei]